MHSFNPFAPGWGGGQKIQPGGKNGEENRTFCHLFPILGKFGGKTQQNIDLFNWRGGRKRNFLQLTGEEKWMDFGYIHLHPF